jgi:hypothetical protein
LRVEGLRFRPQCLGLNVSGFVFRVSGLGLRIEMLTETGLASGLPVSIYIYVHIYMIYDITHTHTHTHTGGGDAAGGSHREGCRG